MKALRVLSAAALILLLAFAISACQKSAQTDMSQTSDTTQVSQNQTAPPPATAPPEQATPSKSTAKTTTRSHKGTSGSSSDRNTTAANAESHTIEIPAGTAFDIVMVTPVDTRTSNAGDHVEGTLAAPLTINGAVVANEGAKVSGEVASIERASKSKSADARASIALDFNTIDTVDGPKGLHATVNNAEGKMVAKGTGTRDKLIIGGSTVAGAIIGKVAGGSTKAMIIGAVGGAAAGTGAMLIAKGHELTIEQGAKVSLRVDQPIAIVQR